DDVERTALIEDDIAGAAVLEPPAAEAYLGATNVQITKRQLGKPRGQVRVDEQEVQRRIGVDAKQRAQMGEDRRRRPGLRGIGARVEPWEGVLRITRVTSDDLRKPSPCKKRSEVELRA